MPPVPIPPIPGGSSPDARRQAADAYHKATGNYRVYNKANATTRQMVGLNNLAEITFDWGAGDAKRVIRQMRGTDIGIYDYAAVPTDPKPVDLAPADALREPEFELMD